MLRGFHPCTTMMKQLLELVHRILRSTESYETLHTPPPDMPHCPPPSLNLAHSLFLVPLLHIAFL